MHDVISQVIRFYWRKCAEADMERHLCFENSLLFKGGQKSGGKMEPGRGCSLAPLLCGKDRLVPFCQAFIPLGVWRKRGVAGGMPSGARQCVARLPGEQPGR